MTAACGCGRCYGCRMAREADERYDTTEDEAREQAYERAERDARDQELAAIAEGFELDDQGTTFRALSAADQHPSNGRRSGDLPSSPLDARGAA